MPPANPQAGASALVSRADAFAEIAQEILSATHRGVDGDWQMPWSGLSRRPANPFSGHAFSGANTLLLHARARKRGLTSPYWAGARAWARSGGRVVRPNAGAFIFMPVFDWTRKTAHRRSQGPLGADPDDPSGNPLIGFKRHVVYNQDDVEGSDVPPPKPPRPFEVVASAEALTQGYLKNQGPALVHRGAVCCYIPKYDRIQMAPRESFQPVGGLDANQHYYSVLLHEAAHSTGSKNRLDRKIADRANANYPREELVAELASAFLGAEIGLATTLRDSHAAYVRHWLQKLGDRRGNFVRAVRDATKAADHILLMAGWTRA